MKVIDADGIPPGMNPAEVEHIGKYGEIKFFGAFYAMGGAVVEFSRPVVIITILRRAIVAQDRENYTIYVIDRELGVSMGCQMEATVTVGEVVL